MGINEFLKEKVDNKQIPGATYAIVSGGIIDIGNVGYKQVIPGNIPNQIDTLYDIASLTKVIVPVTIISKLLDQKKISLDDKVVKYLPLFKYNNITIYDLLTHTSGLPADFEEKEIVSKEEMMSKVYNAPLIYETGSRVLYSDIGYIILGNIIEKIFGKNLDEIAKEEVFIPLHMKDTCYNPLDKSKCAPTEVTKDRGMVCGDVHDEKCYSLGGISGHAGVFSTASDLANFMIMILEDGNVDGKQFISSNILDLWFNPLVMEEKTNRCRSFSWFIGQNYKIIERNGNIISFSGFSGPSIVVDKDNNIGVALLTNRIHPTRTNESIFEIRRELHNYIYKELGIDKPKIKED